jgi:glycine betaine/proline transport system substrate-binding protein
MTQLLLSARAALGACATVLACMATAPAHAQPLPGTGVTVQPIKSSIAEESFQTVLVSRALTRLGYTVAPIKEIEYATGYLALANGDATFMAASWQPLHDDFFKNAGGAAKLYREGTYVTQSVQGYLIDRKTAERYRITSIAQLKDPQIARLFDTNGDGKADLAGCNPGWGCEQVIEHQLEAYGLRGTVTHNQGSYPALIADTLTRFKQGQPVLYYTWTPYWVSGVLKPGKDVVWLQVPFSSLPGVQSAQSTKLPDGRDYGFPVNTQHIVASKAFADKNPAAARLFSVMKLPLADINAQNLRMREGENKPADVERHVDLWIKAHQKQFDGWIAQALAQTK